MRDVRKEWGHLMGEVEGLARRIANEGGECAEESIEQLRRSLGRIQDRLADFERQAGREIRYRVRRTDRYVRHHPWPAIGIAAAVGFALGALLGRRD